MPEKTKSKERKTLTDAERAAKLKELAPARMGRALRGVKQIGLLARYKPNAAQAKAMISALKAAVDGVEGVFAGKTAAEFELPA